VRVVLHLLAAYVSAHLGQSGEDSADARVLRASLFTFVDNHGAAYDASVRPAQKPGGGLGGIFARAQTTAALTPWADMKYDTALTLTCRGCGAPQPNALEFSCCHCGGDIFKGFSP
jgi:hypothetical protein